LDFQKTKEKEKIMKKILGTLIVILVFAAAAFLILRKQKKPDTIPAADNIAGKTEPVSLGTEKNADVASEPSDINAPPPADQQKSVFLPPLDRTSERMTKKKFGQYITPQNSPVRPERFSGYHTGTDFEIFTEELDADVPVKAVCEGKILQKKSATGYGGVLVQNCKLEGENITIVYGHLKLASIAKKSGETLKKGEEIGTLGKASSTETSGERKHLHLGVHKGTAVNILGYVQKKADLSNWIDLCSLGNICQ
jgi:murein DD-endopeptidase MepM/ murein hydrolase activator NlpD